MMANRAALRLADVDGNTPVHLLLQQRDLQDVDDLVRAAGSLLCHGSRWSHPRQKPVVVEFLEGEIAAGQGMSYWELLVRGRHFIVPCNLC
jgi:hypothetical protein